jgi:hypothetical protein
MDRQAPAPPVIAKLHRLPGGWPQVAPQTFLLLCVAAQKGELGQGPRQVRWR